MNIAADANEIRQSISSLKRRRRFRIIGLGLLTVLLGLVFMGAMFFMTLSREAYEPMPMPEPLPTATDTPSGVGTETPLPTGRPTSVPIKDHSPVPIGVPTPMSTQEPMAPPTDTATEPVAEASTQGFLSPELILIFSGIGSFLSALATLSNVILSWRKDRREVEEFRRKLAELELAQAKAGNGG